MTLTEINNEIKEALKPFGYFKPIIYTEFAYIKNKKFAINSTKLGEPLFIQSLVLNIEGSGKNDAELKKYIKTFPLQAHMQFSSPAYENAKKGLFKTAINQGFVDARFNNKITIDMKQYNAAILMALFTGHQYYFGDTIIDTHSYTDDFIRRIVVLNLNYHHFSNEALIDLQQQMEGSPYFTQVNIIPRFEQKKDYHIPIHIDYSVPKERQYQLGVGYGSLTGPRLLAGFKLPRITRTGHHFSSELILSSVQSRFSAQYVIPGQNPLKDNWTISADLKNFEPKAGISKSLTAGVGYATQIKNIKLEMSFNGLAEHFKIDHTEHLTSYMIYPNFNASYLKLDNIINPSSGISAAFNLRGTTQPFPTSIRFVQPEFNTKALFNPYSTAKIILRGNLGYTTARSLNRFPLSLRYFAGGINSIRGFADMSIGPGRYLMVGSAEFQQPVYKEFSAAVFYDIGTATDTLPSPMNRGVGVGAIYNSLLGPLKLYLARAISKPSRPYSVEFIIGPEFS